MRFPLRGPVVALLALACAVLTGAACTGDGGSSSPVFGETECAACIETACSAELAACTALSDCDAALACTLDCPVQDNALDTDCAGTECAGLVTTSAGGTAFDGVIACYFAESAASGTCESQCAPPTD